MNGQLVVSLTGIRDTTREVVEGFAREMDVRGVPLSLCVAPRLGGRYTLLSDPGTQEWLLERREGGDAIVLHGYDPSSAAGRHPEFARLPRHEARLRLLAADRVLEETGLRTRLFAPPRWRASTGAVAALPQAGFRMILEHNVIRDLSVDAVMKSQVYGIGDGAPSGHWWCRAVVAESQRVTRRGELFRLAVSAPTLAAPGLRRAVLAAIDVALRHGADPTVYRRRSAPKRRVAV